MTDKFEKITDDELIEEVESRRLENEFDCDCSDAEEIAVEEYITETSRYTADIELSDLNILCDAYQYKSKDEFVATVVEFLNDHAGLIA